MMTDTAHDHYDENYYNWHKNIGAFGGWANQVKFVDFVKPEMNVADFGCGGGFLLHNLRCNGKVGIEINDVARASISADITAYKYVAEMEDDWADLIISNHALEHVPDPLSQLRLLKSKLKNKGRIIFVVPCESIYMKYYPGNMNYHLFSWSPMNLGNLFNEAGFKVLESQPFFHKWPPHYHTIAKLFGRKVFNQVCRLYSKIETTWFQARVIAERRD